MTIDQDTLIPPDYRYVLAQVIRVIDGDTVEVKISKDVGFYLTVSWDLHIRLDGVDCPETNRVLTRKAGLAASEFTRKWLESGTFVVETVAKAPGKATGKTSFERWVARIIRQDGVSLGDALVEAGHAVRV